MFLPTPLSTSHSLEICSPIRIPFSPYCQITMITCICIVVPPHLPPHPRYPNPIECHLQQCPFDTRKKVGYNSCERKDALVVPLDRPIERHAGGEMLKGGNGLFAPGVRGAADVGGGLFVQGDAGGFGCSRRRCGSLLCVCW
ncbi:hypothetical protein BDY17DRAFT_12018 [Neohortaea acidophila]|uniref:Uncharacterized protein n=1 Tax=Neohortaea acidophila TaxID=245834 RepID=A0A6A6Q659_9PEZI|nr:uncharacterized protein BDY17DRAFT_12018 [Neohortaea acidophila]KAF2487464.1 hypothetical protein BDY17DRAFT_12018 [Neohortaea acidophila]